MMKFLQPCHVTYSQRLIAYNHQTQANLIGCVLHTLQKLPPHFSGIH